MEAILKIFTTEDQNELKQAFKEMIKEQFKNDLEQNERYLFDPNEIEAVVQEAFQDVINEAKADFKERLNDEMQKLLGNINIEKLLKLKTR